MNVGELSVKLGIDDSQFSKGLSQADRTMKKVSDKMFSVGKNMTKKVTLPVVGAFAGMLKGAMSLEATEAKYNTVFEGMTEISDAFIKDFQKLTPATTAEARTMTSGIQDLLIPMGFMRDEATELTGELFHVIGALTNFNSETHKAEDVTGAFSSALVGQFEPLKRLGINTNKAEVEQRALTMGLAETVDELEDTHLALALTEIAYEKSGDALNAYNEENLDTKTKMGLMKAEMIDVAGSFGSHLLPIMTNVIEKARELTSWFGELTVEQQGLIIKIMAVAGAIGPLLIIGSKLIKAFMVLKGAIIGLSLPMLGFIAVGIAIGAMLIHLWRTNEEFRDKIKAIWTAIVNLWEEHGEAIMSFAKTTFEFVGNIINNTLDFIMGIVGVFIGIFTGDWQKFNESATKVWKALWDTIKLVLSAVWGILKGIFGSLLRSVINWFTGLRNDATAKVRELVTGFRDIISNAWTRLKGAFGGLLVSITSWFTGLPKQALTWGRNMIGGFIDGIKAMGTRVANAAKDTVKKAADFLKFWSPAKKGEGRFIRKWGANMIEGFLDGVEDMTPEVSKVIGKVIPKMDVNMAGIGSIGKAPISTTTNNESIMNEFNIAQLVVREEADVEKLSRELFRLQDKRRRNV